jgi:hypothetical protein
MESQGVSVGEFDAALAGDLLRASLTAKSNPVSDRRYREALEAYLSQPTFREQVHGLATGLGLRIVEGGERGLVVAPQVDSLFTYPAREFRPSSTTVEQRLIDGLIMVAIAAVCYPRAQDLDQNPALARPPITVSQVERLLRDGVARRAADTAGPDTTPEEREQGLEPAWRVFARLPEVRETVDGRAGSRTSRRRIAALLEKLADLGAFTTEALQGEPAWRPTYRWQVQVQEFAATYLWDEVQRAFSLPGTEDA